jgi:hypothetical protein
MLPGSNAFVGARQISALIEILIQVAVKGAAKQREPLSTAACR